MSLFKDSEYNQNEYDIKDKLSLTFLNDSNIN
jgi:hypothetical protein